jgi:hypothetical protein
MSSTANFRDRSGLGSLERHGALIRFPRDRVAVVSENEPQYLIGQRFSNKDQLWRAI